MDEKGEEKVKGGERQEGKRLNQRGGHSEVAGALQGTEAAVTTFTNDSHLV